MLGASGREQPAQTLFETPAAADLAVAPGAPLKRFERFDQLQAAAHEGAAGAAGSAAAAHDTPGYRLRDAEGLFQSPPVNPVGFEFPQDFERLGNPMKIRRPVWHDKGYRNSLRSGTFVSHTSLWASEMGRCRKILARDKRTYRAPEIRYNQLRRARQYKCSHRFRLAGRGTGPPRTAGRAGPRFHRGRQGRELQARLPLRLAPVCGLVPAPGASRPAGHARTVTLYMTALAADHKPASLQRKLTSITKAHQAAGFPSPATMQHAVVSETMKGIRRTLGTAQPGKEPLLTADIREMLDSLDDDLQGCRDRALLLAGFAGGFRRSELAALDIEDVSDTEDGLVIRVRRSKTDPEGT